MDFHENYSHLEVFLIQYAPSIGLKPLVIRSKKIDEVKMRNKEERWGRNK